MTATICSANVLARCTTCSCSKINQTTACQTLSTRTHSLQTAQNINPLDYRVWGWMLDKFNRPNPQPKNIPELRTALLVIWDELSQEAIRKSIVSFRKRLRACINAKGTHFKYEL